MDLHESTELRAADPTANLTYLKGLHRPHRMWKFESKLGDFRISLLLQAWGEGKSSLCTKDTEPSLEISPLWNKSLKPQGAKQQTHPLRTQVRDVSAGNEMETSHSWGKDRKTP